jgi:hypothetical protein
VGQQVWRSASSGIVVVFAMIAVVPGDARAQGPDYGYVIGGLLWANSLGTPSPWFAGVGGEKVWGDGIGWGGEAGLVILPGLRLPYLPESSTTYGAAFSLNYSYHLRGHCIGARGQPFVTGGVTGLWSDGGVGLSLNAGGGVDLWLTRHSGIRIEVRDQFPFFPGARAGIVFR